MRKTWLLILLVLSLWGCTSFSAYYKLGNEAEMNKDWDKAIEYYKKAIIEDPTEPSYRYSLTRAQIAASFYHLGEARKLAAAGKTEEAAKEYERSLFYDPQNRLIAEEMKRVTQPEEIKEEPKKEKLEYPVKLKVARDKIDLKFTDASLRSIFQALGKHAQINIIFDELFKDMPVTIDLTGKEFEEAVSFLCLASKNFYRIVDERTLIIVPDQPVKRIQYEQNAIKVFYLSNINVQDIFAPLTQMLRTQYRAPNIFADKNLNTITVRDTPSNIEMAEELIMKWDKPKGEVIVEIEIMEVNRQKLREMGIDYSALATGLAYAGPGAVGTEGSEGWFILGQLDFTTAESFAINLPTAFLRYLETDADTKILAQPKLRGLADEELRTLVGQKIPLPQTTFQPIAAGGVSQQPVVSYTYEDVGLDIKVKPRLHLEKEITLEIELKLSSIVGEGFAGIPIIGNREIKNIIRLRDGETNLLVGLLKEASQPLAHEPSGGLDFVEAARQDDRNPGIELLQLLEGLLSVHDRHGRVENDKGDVSGMLLEDIQTLLAVPGKEHGMSEALEHGFHHAQHVLLVVRHEDGPLPPGRRRLHGRRRG